MIEATFTFDVLTQDIVAVEISGHAGFDVYGSDIVCSGISILLISTINALEEYVGINTKANVEEGHTTFQLYTADSTKRLQAQALAHSLYMAYQGIEEEYSEYVHVISKEV